MTFDERIDQFRNVYKDASGIWDIKIQGKKVASCAGDFDAVVEYLRRVYPVAEVEGESLTFCLVQSGKNEYALLQGVPVVRIEHEYANGIVMRALGKDAHEIDKANDNMVVHWYIHGGRYKGPTMKKVVDPFTNWTSVDIKPPNCIHGVVWVGEGDGREYLMTYYDETGFVDPEGNPIEGVTYWLEIRRPGDLRRAKDRIQ